MIDRRSVISHHWKRAGAKRRAGNGEGHAMKRILFGASAAALLLATPGLAQSNAEVMRQLQAMQAQIEALKAEVDSAKAEAAAARTQSAAAETKVTAATAEGGALVSGGKTGVRVSLSGQVNRGVLFTDDGDSTDAFFVDNDNSSTRIRILGEADYDENTTIGTNIEVQFESNSTADVNQNSKRNVGNDNFTQRKLELYVDNKQLGRLTLGQGDTASNGTSEQDLSGTTVIGYSGVTDFAGGLFVRDSNTNALTGLKINDVTSNLDGLSRDDRIRYDTPKFSGFSLATSAVADDRYDVALFYGDRLGDVEVRGAVSYASASASGTANAFDIFNGSVSALHVPSGVSATFAAGTRDTDNQDNDTTFYYGKLGYQTNFFDFGKTAISADLYYGEEFVTADDETFSVGLQLVQNIKKAGAELYGGFRLYDYDDSATDYETLYGVMVGARVKF